MCSAGGRECSAPAGPVRSVEPCITGVPTAAGTDLPSLMTLASPLTFMT